MRLAILSVLCSVHSIAQAATVITNDIGGVGPNNSVRPYVCIQNKNGEMTYALAPSERVDAARYSGNMYYAGAAIRFGGCAKDNTYLGYIGIGLGNSFTLTYQAPKNIHIEYANPAINANGHLLGDIRYTAIQANFNLSTTTPAQYIELPFRGINLSGLEFGKVIDPTVIPNLSQEDAYSSYSDLQEMQAYLQAGMNTVRIPINWGFLQLNSAGVGELNLQYYNAYVKPLLETLTSAHVYTIVDLHAYMRYSQFGKEYAGCAGDSKCPDGTLILDAKAYEDVWSKLVNLIKADPKIDMTYIMLDLVNEPVNVPNDNVFTIQASVIKKLRQQGYLGYILVEGNIWSGLHSWNTTWQSTDGKKTYSNEQLFSRENFMRAGITDLTKIVINVHQYLDSDYSGTHDECLTDLTTVGPNGFNLNAFADYLKRNQLQAMITEFGGGKDSQTCKVALKKFVDYLQANAARESNGGFIGWTLWSAGHGWGNYNLRVTPTSYHMNILNNS